MIEVLKALTTLVPAWKLGADGDSVPHSRDGYRKRHTRIYLIIATTRCSSLRLPTFVPDAPYATVGM